MTGIDSDWSSAVVHTIDRIRLWQESFGAFDAHPSVRVDPTVFRRSLDDLLDRLTKRGDMYPFFHPRYAGQMLKPPHPVATVGYLAAQLINPNNHALDGGPATAEMEREVMSEMAAMFGWPTHMGHLTSSGTVANLEALWVGREQNPGGAVAVSRDAHYTHQRMCKVLGVRCIPVPVDALGRMSVDHLSDVLRENDVATVVATLGSTGLGSIDPLDEIVPLARDAGARIHVDAAYGGFFALVADGSDDGVAVEPYAALTGVDSIVVDPHKHGLQPYGCGAVLFADPGVGRHYRHDSPYTYFTSDDLHLGEISLECSRAGAAAAALWLTTRIFPLTPSGLGSVLRPGLKAARQFYDLLSKSGSWRPVQRPQTDIVGFLTRREVASDVDGDTSRVFTWLSQAPSSEQWHIAMYGMSNEDLRRREIVMEPDLDPVRVGRSVLMKPEHEFAVADFMQALEQVVEG